MGRRKNRGQRRFGSVRLMAQMDGWTRTSAAGDRLDSKGEGRGGRGRS